MTRQREPMEVYLSSSASEQTLKASLKGVAAKVAPLFINAQGNSVMLIGSESLGGIRAGKDKLEIDVRVTYRPLRKANLNLPCGKEPFFGGANFYYKKDDASVPNKVEEFTLCSERDPTFPPEERGAGGVIRGDLTKKVYHIWRK